MTQVKNSVYLPLYLVFPFRSSRPHYTEHLKMGHHNFLTRRSWLISCIMFRLIGLHWVSTANTP